MMFRIQFSITSQNTQNIQYIFFYLSYCARKQAQNEIKDLIQLTVSFIAWSVRDSEHRMEITFFSVIVHMHKVAAGDNGNTR